MRYYGSVMRFCFRVHCEETRRKHFLRFLKVFFVGTIGGCSVFRLILHLVHFPFFLRDNAAAAADTKFLLLHFPRFAFSQVLPSSNFTQ